jgi:hypothetical protein
MVPARIRLSLIAAAPLILIGLPSLFAESVKYSGALIVLTDHSIWLKQANGVVIVARLPATASSSAQILASRYHTGDQVLIKGVRIETTFDDKDRLWFNVDVKNIEYLRPGSAAEIVGALASAARRRRDNLLRSPEGDAPSPKLTLKSLRAPDASDNALTNDAPGELLERSRTATQKFLTSLPNFTADETSIRYWSPVTDPPRWRVTENLQSEVSFRQTREEHRNVIRNGTPWNDLFEHVPAAVRAREQHGLLANLFDPTCGVNFEFSRRTTEGGESVLIYRFTSQPDSCFPADAQFEELYFAGHAGEVSIGESDCLVRRIESATTGYPNEFPWQLAEDRATWAYIQIGDERHLLPVRTERLQVNRTGLYWSIRKFEKHRHFEANSVIIYK